MTQSALTQRLVEARRGQTPQVVAALEDLARAAQLLVDELEADPGMGLGLSYAPLWARWQEAAHLIRQYQNGPLDAETAMR